MEETKCQNPDMEPTRKQTWAVFCMTKQDIRGHKLTRGEVSQIIDALKSNGKATLPNGEELVSKSGGNGGGQVKDWSLALSEKAHKAGLAAMQELIDSGKVVPMLVVEHENMLDDNSPAKRAWKVDGGPCGYASLHIKLNSPKNRQFIAGLKKAGAAGPQNSFKLWTKDNYRQGYSTFVHEGGQSLAYKEAYAYGYAKALGEEGVTVYVHSNLD